MDTNIRATVLIPEIHLAATIKALHANGCDVALIAPIIDIAKTFPGIDAPTPKRHSTKRSHHKTATKKPTTKPRKGWSKAARRAASQRAKAAWRAKQTK